MNPVEWVVWWNGFFFGVLASSVAFVVGGLAAAAALAYIGRRSKPAAPPTSRPVTRGDVREAARYVVGTRPLDELLEQIKQENEAIDIWNEADQPGGRA